MPSKEEVEKLKREKNEKEEVMDKKKKEEKEEEESNEIRNMQLMQQKQLQDLQQQVQLFLQTSPPNKSVPTSESSVQCSPPSPPLLSSIGVNTGRSLLWPTENLAITQSDTALRGTQQAVLPKALKANEKKKTRKWCKCCQHCDRTLSSKSIPTPSNMSSQLSQSQLLDADDEVEMSTLSEMQSEDIPSINDTADSNHTMASSLQRVDLPVFDGTREEAEEISETPIKHRSRDDEWDKSPELGESASVLQQQKQLENEVETNLLNNKEFYQQMMSQVHKLIKAQHHSNVSDENTDQNNAVYNKSTDQSEDERVMEPAPYSSRENFERVREATAKELQKLTSQPYEEEIRHGRQRSMSAISPPYPKINYVSMSVDDTFYDTSPANINEIAAKYLPDKMLNCEYTNNKTVKFQGVYEWQSRDRATGGSKHNMASVNFSCNMSIASKKYLQKYDLVSGNERIPLKEKNQRGEMKSQSDETLDGKENKILDLKKLKSLQKLT